MRRSGWTILALALLLPAAAEAQRPASTMHTRSADLYLQQADETQVPAEKSENFERALEQARAGIEAIPANPTAWMQAAKANAGLGRLAAADSAFDRAEELWPDYGEEIGRFRLALWANAYNAAIPLFTERKFEEAVARLEEADLIYQDRPEAMELLGTLYAQLGRSEDAERLYRRTLRLVSGPLRGEQTPEAQEAWATVQQNVALDLSNLLASGGRLDEAEALYRELLAANPEDALVKGNLAVVLSQQGREDEANAIYTELLENPDISTGEAFNIGITLFRGENYAPAARAFDRAVTANPWAYDALYMLGQSLFFTGQALQKDTAADPATTLATFEKLAEVAGRLDVINPLNPDVLVMLAQAYRGMGDLTEGTAAMEWKKQGLSALERRQALAFEFTDVEFSAAEGSAAAAGTLVNHTLAEGAPMAFRFVVVDAAGNEVAGQDMRLVAPAAGGSVALEVSIPVPGEVSGWRIIPAGG